MSDDRDWKKVGKKTVDGANGFIKGNQAYHATEGYKYTVAFDTSTATAVSVIDKTATSAKAAAKGLPPKGDWVFRLDHPHRGADFNHVNINPKISGKTDPHLPLPPGGLQAGTGAAKFAKAVNKVNKVAVPLAVAVDVAQVGVAMYDDYQNGTTRNTVETVASVAGGWSGGYGGAVTGAALGTAILPGVGTIIGGIAGGLGGGIGGALGAGALAETIGDACEYDIVEKTCKKCGKKYKIRAYRSGPNGHLCPDCDSNDQ